ncbi:MAG: MotA/TolQ/ExbB proton channel family protein [Pirellulaceae bacterium]|nr:MotA/TolQ/ExbB proton channel family protein [Pirellulaceae bacterium]
MARAQSKSLINIIGNLGWPILWGAAASITFYELLQGPLKNDLAQRYFLGHPVAIATTVMFFIAMAALILRGLNLLGQFALLDRADLPAKETTAMSEDSLSCATAMLGSASHWSPRLQRSYLGKRITTLLETIVSNRSTRHLNDELKYQSEKDADAQYEGYSLVRIIIWATPMLGFLGTVMGITQALGDLATQQLGNDLNAAMQGLFAGLYVAFDTTALALTLSIMLMFIQFMSDQFETQLLSTVDVKAEDALSGLLAMESKNAGSSKDMAESLRPVITELTQFQQACWSDAISGLQQQWQTWAAEQGSTMGAALELSMSRSLAEHSKVGQLQWESWMEALNNGADLLNSNQDSMRLQMEMMQQVVETTGDVVSLETSLNDNLQHLSDTRQFEDIIISLSAAIQLLSTRLGAPLVQPGAIDSSTQNGNTKGKAA